MTAPDPKTLALRASCQSRMEAMRGFRIPWWAYWAALAEMYLPYRYRWFVTPNNYARGSPLNQSIVDETGVVAARTLATGLLANLTSPTKPWFRLGLAGIDVPEGSPSAVWLAECTRRMLTIYAGSNFYNTLGTAYRDLGVFGSSALIQYEDDENIIHFFNPCLGEFFFGLDNRLEVNTLYREYTYTIQSTVEEFGLANVSESTRIAYKTPSNRDMEIVIGHAIEPNYDIYQSGENFGKALPDIFPWREVFWESSMGGNSQQRQPGSILRCRGFREKPFVGLRWDVTSNDPYGRSPGMEALPAVRQLQIEQRRKAEAIDKMVRPPMVGSVAMKNEPASILPGGITYTADPQANGFKPAFQVEPRVAELMEDLREVQDRVRQVMFNPLFTGITDLTTVRTATEIDARLQEKLVMLGPVVERIESEGLDDIISRTFAIMSRRGLFPPPPPEIAGAPIKVFYISLLAEAQRASEVTAIERTFAFAGNLAAVKPEILDGLNADKGLSRYAGLLNTPPDVINTAETIDAIRANRAEQMRAQAQLEAADKLATGAKTLSDTSVGGGQNALQLMLQ